MKNIVKLNLSSWIFISVNCDKCKSNYLLPLDTEGIESDLTPPWTRCLIWTHLVSQCHRINSICAFLSSPWPLLSNCFNDESYVTFAVQKCTFFHQKIKKILISGLFLWLVQLLIRLCISRVYFCPPILWIFVCAIRIVWSFKPLPFVTSTLFKSFVLFNYLFSCFFSSVYILSSFARFHTDRLYAGLCEAPGCSGPWQSFIVIHSEGSFSHWTEHTDV